MMSVGFSSLQLKIMLLRKTVIGITNLEWVVSKEEHHSYGSWRAAHIQRFARVFTERRETDSLRL